MLSLAISFLVCCGGENCFAQTTFTQNSIGRIIDGWVVDHDKYTPATPVCVSNVNISVKGTNNKTETNAKGEFILFNVPVNGILVFQKEGFKTIEAPVNKIGGDGRWICINFGRTTSSVSPIIRTSRNTVRNVLGARIDSIGGRAGVMIGHKLENKVRVGNTIYPQSLLQKLFDSGTAKTMVEACMDDDHIVRDITTKIIEYSGSFNIKQVCDIFDYCLNNWKYVSDPNERNGKQDYYSKAARTLIYTKDSNGKIAGDCDDFAILMCTMINSIGGTVRINHAWNKESAHAFGEVKIDPNSLQSIVSYIQQRYQDKVVWYRRDRDGSCWLNLDWQGTKKHPCATYYDFTDGISYSIPDGKATNFADL